MSSSVGAGGEHAPEPCDAGWALAPERDPLSDMRKQAGEWRRREAEALLVEKSLSEQMAKASRALWAAREAAAGLERAIEAVEKFQDRAVHAEEG